MLFGLGLDVTNTSAVRAIGIAVSPIAASSGFSGRAEIAKSIAPSAVARMLPLLPMLGMTIDLDPASDGEPSGDVLPHCRRTTRATKTQRVRCHSVTRQQRPGEKHRACQLQKYMRAWGTYPIV